MHPFRNLEMHVVHSCNLACESCSHYSNQGHKGMVTLEEAEQWMRLWSGRLAPENFVLLGGEPTIHPKLPEFLILARRYWPNARLRLITNGFFLHRHPTLPAILSADRDAEVRLSVHHDAPEYREKLAPVLRLLRGWQREHRIRVDYYGSHKQWTRRYRGFGAAMEPFEDRQPRRSWVVCPAKQCKQLFEGKIWKCGPIAYLQLQGAKYQLSAQWEPYLRYTPLEPGCTDEELRAFFAIEEEACCGMCPAKPEKFSLPLPLPGRREAAAVATL
jgi:MoaA/NifB/PqqE/SkfB family radical SAM enzyme